MQDSALSLLPPIAAIVIAVWRKNAFFALLAGLWLCFFLSQSFSLWQGSLATGESIINVFSSLGNVYIVSFSLLIGALITLMNHSGAVNGFINSLNRLNLVTNEKRVSLLPTVIGSSIFTDTNLSMFSAGMASQKLFDQHKLSRARLAYLIDSTCAPISILLLINGWGAYVLGLLDGYQLSDPVGVLIATIGYNFYAIIAVALAYYTAISGKVYGPMKLSSTDTTSTDNSATDDSSTPRALSNEQQTQNRQAKARVMWLPMLTLLAVTFALLFYTGNGDIRRGSGSFSVFWGIISALSLLIIMINSYRLMSFNEQKQSFVEGIKKMAPVVAILVLSFAFGDGIKALGTGLYISQLISPDVPLFLIAPLIFIAAGAMAFSTGTSWGTFAVLIPIAMPIAAQTGLPVPFLVAAVLGGGIFGDHASPISDTTIVASLASGCDHFEHVKTQLPYALTGGVLTIVLYSLVGLAL